jgi:hypothetical protein
LFWEQSDFDTITTPVKWKDFVSKLIIASFLLFTLVSCSSTVQETLAAVPTLEEQASPMPDGKETPVQEWRGVPIMPDATAGLEFAVNNAYSFEVKASAQDVQDFYEERLTELGWSQPFDSPFDENGGTITFRKEQSRSPPRKALW